MKGKRGKPQRRVLVVSTLLLAVAVVVPFFGVFDTGQQVSYYLVAVVADWIVINLFAHLFKGAER